MTLDLDTIDTSALDGLSEAERKAALSMLAEISETGRSKALEEMEYADYEEIPVDIGTFLTDPEYLGRGLTNEEGKFTVFPYWVKTLKRLFPTNVDTAYNTLILTGGIGLGKSLCAVLCQLYLLYRMMCLKDPYLHYGLQPIDKITFSLMNITIDAAKGVAWDKMQQLLQSSDWFMRRGTMKGTSSKYWAPPKGIELIVGSRNNHIIGRAVFANFTDEVNFDSMTDDVDKKKKKQLRLITQVDARMQSRFMKGTRLPTLNIIASSKDQEHAFLESYIELKKKNESKTTLIVDEPQWVIRTDKDSPEKFYVAVGNKFLASEVLPKDAPESLINSYRDKGYQMLKVPIGYYENFRDNVELALTDIAGISTVSALKYISGQRWNEAKVDSYLNPFTRDVITVGNAADDRAQYGDFFDLSRVPKDCMAKPLYVHLDLSKSGDKTGIAGVWAMGKSQSGDGREAESMRYRVAFSVSVQAPKGYEISFDKARNFIRWLRSMGFSVKSVTSDTYQSVQILQQLKADGFKADTLSVDRLEALDGSKHRICKPYAYFKATLYEGRLQVYRKCDLLTEEIIGLEREPDGHINHPENGAFGSKDQADAVVGALYDASLHVDDYAYDYGEDFDVMMGVDKDAVSESEMKKQITVDFEEALRNSRPILSSRTKEDEERERKEWEERNAGAPAEYGNMLVW